MGMNLGIKKVTYNPSEDQSWLASSSGTQSMDSITLGAANALTLFPTGVVPSGVPLIFAAGVYRCAITAEVPEYHLFTTVDLTAGGAIPLANVVDTPCSGLWQGEIIAAKVPAYAGKTSAVAARTVVGNIKYV
jgi:hypothetical protein